MGGPLLSMYIDSGTASFPGVTWLASTTTATLAEASDPNTTAYGIGGEPNLAVASGDVFIASFTYEAA